MALNAPAAPSGKSVAAGLRHAHCLFHPLREAAARCPHCGGTFCCECVTDEDNRLACPPCLRRTMQAPAKPAPGRRFLQSFAGIAALVCLAALFFALLRWRVNIPEAHLSLGDVTYRQPGGPKP